ncbi:dihydroorotate dehydrogenase [Patescibacteria group bacterium]|nr:dihydroorotate dehydrogenase [Patescibacteria group bacterium]
MLRQKILGIEFKNPFVLASGIMNSNEAVLLNSLKRGCAAVTTKSTNLKGKEGHPAPNFAPFEAGYINAVGLKNHGVKEEIASVNRIKAETDAPIFFSIFGKEVSEFAAVAKEASKSEADFLEVNISCPNVQKEFGLPFAFDNGKVEEITRAVKRNSSKPVFVKLSPNVPRIVETAKAAQEGGADGLTAINTVGPGLLLDLKTKKPRITNGVGGVSGAAIRPVAQRCVFDIFKEVDLPIIGLGGVETRNDVLEMMMVGATLVGIGSVTYKCGLTIFDKLSEEVETYLIQEKYKNVSDLIGLAHR